MFDRRSRETVLLNCMLCDFEELLLIQLILDHPEIYHRELQQLLYHSSRCYNLQNSASARNDTAAHKAPAVCLCKGLKSNEQNFGQKFQPLNHPSCCGLMRLGVIEEMRFESMAMTSPARQPP